jgi:hypothetical protein
MITPCTIGDLKIDPDRHFTSPQEVLDDDRLTDAEKLEILVAWERDARALSVAADEGMTGGEPDGLRPVTRARIQLEERIGSGKRGDGSSKAL